VLEHVSVERWAVTQTQVSAAPDPAAMQAL
jgi:hypothetical protein